MWLNTQILNENGIPFSFNEYINKYLWFIMNEAFNIFKNKLYGLYSGTLVKHIYTYSVYEVKLVNKEIIILKPLRLAFNTIPEIMVFPDDFDINLSVYDFWKHFKIIKK